LRSVLPGFACRLAKRIDERCTYIEDQQVLVDDAWRMQVVDVAMTARDIERFAHALREHARQEAVVYWLKSPTFNVAVR
jgi:hypothetical protein